MSKRGKLSPESFPRASNGGRYWDRTSDLCRVNPQDRSLGLTFTRGCYAPVCMVMYLKAPYRCKHLVRTGVAGTFSGTFKEYYKERRELLAAK